MQLNLDLDGIEFRFRITKYEKSNSENLYKLYDQWCIVELSLRSGSWLNYQISSEVLLSYEVEEIRDKISDFLEDKIQLQEELGFVEPDLTFIIRKLSITVLAMMIIMLFFVLSVMRFVMCFSFG